MPLKPQHAAALEDKWGEVALWVEGTVRILRGSLNQSL